MTRVGDGHFIQNNEREIELRSGGCSGVETGRNERLSDFCSAPKPGGAEIPHARTESNNQNRVRTPVGAILEHETCRARDLMPKSDTEADRQTDSAKNKSRRKSEKMKPAATNSTGTDKTHAQI
jgi:hypothetical protein